MNICACTGPIGNDIHCPCEMKKNGLPVTITEMYISPELFSHLSDEDKREINRIKLKALNTALTNRSKKT